MLTETRWAGNYTWWIGQPWSQRNHCPVFPGWRVSEIISLSPGGWWLSSRGFTTPGARCWPLRPTGRAVAQLASGREMQFYVRPVDMALVSATKAIPFPSPGHRGGQGLRLTDICAMSQVISWSFGPPLEWMLSAENQCLTPKSSHFAPFHPQVSSPNLCAQSFFQGPDKPDGPQLLLRGPYKFLLVSPHEVGALWKKFPLTTNSRAISE